LVGKGKVCRESVLANPEPIGPNNKQVGIKREVEYGSAYKRYR
jgi:hypothetical protein